MPGRTRWTGRCRCSTRTRHDRYAFPTCGFTVRYTNHYHDSGRLTSAARRDAARVGASGIRAATSVIRPMPLFLGVRLAQAALLVCERSMVVLTLSKRCRARPNAPRQSEGGRMVPMPVGGADTPSSAGQVRLACRIPAAARHTDWPDTSTYETGIGAAPGLPASHIQVTDKT